MSFRDFLKEYWYLLTMGILTLVMVIIYTITWFMKNEKQSFPTNCSPNSAGYISDISIGSNTNDCPNGFCCPITGQWESIPINGINPEYLNAPINGLPNSQVCQTSDNQYCDQTAIVTDMKLVDMTDPTDPTRYKPMSSRCCDPNDPTCNYYPPMSVNLPNPSDADVGILMNSVSGCKKMGLCVQKQLLGTLRQNHGTYLPKNNVSFVVNTNPVLNGTQACQTILGDAGYVSDNVNLYEGCSNTQKQLFLCKKYSNI